jgi:putative glycosyltransferase (TIGR04372 family)
MFSKKGWNYFLSALKKGDFSNLISIAYISVGLRLLALLCAIPIVLILWILKPVFWIKIGKLDSSRIGHLAINTDLFLRRRQLGIHPDGPFYCFLSDPKHVANRQLLTMWKRLIPICESRALSVLFERMLPLLKKTPFYQDLPCDSNEYYEFNNASSSLYFTQDENEKGRKLLKQMNVDLDKDEYVCIFARDDAYLKNLNPHHNWNYHNTRNSNIDGLIETAKYLIEKGFIVIRVGSIVKKPINFSHEKMIDLPYSGHRSDFMDIFLLAHCKFFIGAGSSGINDVTDIFDIPRLVVAVGEFGFCPVAKNCLYTPKKYRRSNTNDYLHFEEARKMDHYWWRNPAAFGLEAEETSPQEILEATQEMLARLEGKFKYSPESEKLIQAYHKLWNESGLTGSPNKTPIGIAWLKQNRDLYF